MLAHSAGHCSSRAESKAADGTVLDVRWQCMRGALKQAKHGERIFRSLYGQSKGTDTFWLDRCALPASTASCPIAHAGLPLGRV